MRRWMVWSRRKLQGTCWKNSYTCCEKGRLCVSVFHYNIHLKSIDACQSWKTPLHFFGMTFLFKSLTVPMLSHVFSYLASECSVCLQPYSVAHSSSKEWYVATKESLHWCHNNGRPWRCNNRSWMSLRTEGWFDTQSFSRNPSNCRGPPIFHSPYTQQSYWDKWDTSHFKVCERLSLYSGGAGCFEIIGNSDNTTIFTHATAKNQRDFALRVHPLSGRAQVSSAHPAWAYRALQRWWCIWHSSPQKSTLNKDQHPRGCGRCPSSMDIDIRVC